MAYKTVAVMKQHRCERVCAYGRRVIIIIIIIIIVIVIICVSRGHMLYYIVFYGDAW